MSVSEQGPFRLETVFRIASSQEEQLAHQMALLQEAHRAEEARLLWLRQLQAQALQEQCAASDRETLSVPRLLQASSYAEILTGRIRLQMDVLDESLERVENCRSLLLAASQRRRMLEKLKEQQRERRHAYLERLEVADAAETSNNQYLRRRAADQGAEDAWNDRAAERWSRAK